MFWVLRSARKVCTSIGAGCIDGADDGGACKCNEEIVFEVSDGFNPEEANKKFLPIR